MGALLMHHAIAPSNAIAVADLHDVASSRKAIEILPSAYKVEIKHEEQNLRWQKVQTLKTTRRKS